MKNNTEETQKKIMAIISDAVTLGKINAIHEKRIEIILSQHSANPLVIKSVCGLCREEKELKPFNLCKECQPDFRYASRTQGDISVGWVCGRPHALTPPCALRHNVPQICAVRD